MLNEERLKILKLLETGKVNADEAARLLEAVGEGGDAPTVEGRPAGKGKTLKIRVFKGDSSRPSVNVNVPFSLARWAMKFAPENSKARMGDREIRLDELGSLLDKGLGEVITVEDHDKNERIEISVE
jgi:hypothetical protein